MMQTTPSAATLRAELARRRLKIYRLAPLVDLHPARLGFILNEHAPLPADLAERLMREIEKAAPLEG